MLTRVLIAAVFASNTTAMFPDLPPAKNYIHVAQISVGTVSKKWRLTSQQKAAAFAFIFHRYPVREFERLSLDDSPLLMRGRTAASVRRTPEYRSALDACNVVSQQMAKIIIKDALHTYRRKVLNPDELTRPLFASTSDKDIEDAIAGIWREATHDEFLRVSNSSFPIHIDDKLYSYTTSFGGGYLVVRDGKVIKKEHVFEY